MGAIICPNILFINDENWNDTKNRDVFLKNLTITID